MTRLLCVLTLLALAAVLSAQESAPSALASPAPSSPSSPPRAEKTNPLATALPGDLFAPGEEGVTTEIFADAVEFNSKDYIGTFTGRVIVKDPRFNLQADKLIVYLARGETRGLERVVAEGNVAVVREAPNEEGGPPVRSVGRAERAVYTANDGHIEMTGTPRVQSGLNSHVATSPDTVMIINQSGQLTTRGPSRTELRQEPKIAAPPKP